MSATDRLDCLHQLYIILTRELERLVVLLFILSWKCWKRQNNTETTRNRSEVAPITTAAGPRGESDLADNLSVSQPPGCE